MVSSLTGCVHTYSLGGNIYCLNIITSQKLGLCGQLLFGSLCVDLLQTYSHDKLFNEYICSNCSAIIYFILKVYIYFVNVSWCCWLNSIMHFSYILYMFFCGWVLNWCFFLMVLLSLPTLDPSWTCNLLDASSNPLSSSYIIVYFYRTSPSRGLSDSFNVLHLHWEHTVHVSS